MSILMWLNYWICFEFQTGLLFLLNLAFGCGVESRQFNAREWDFTRVNEIAVVDRSIKNCDKLSNQWLSHQYNNCFRLLNRQIVNLWPRLSATLNLHLWIICLILILNPNGCLSKSQTIVTSKWCILIFWF
jgi:hypothetical protein